MKRNAFVFAVLAVAILGMLTLGKWADRRRPKHASTSSLVGDLQGAQAPDFELTSLDGRKVKLSDFRGKAVVLNFWATWCAPCKIEMPWFVELQREYGAQGFQIVGVAMDDSSKEDIAKFAQDMGVNYPVLLGKEAVGEEYGGVPALPESFFIGRDGKIVDKIIGLRGRAEIEDAIKRTLETPSASVSSPETMRAQN